MCEKAHHIGSMHDRLLTFCGTAWTFPDFVKFKYISWTWEINLLFSRFSTTRRNPVLVVILSTPIRHSATRWRHLDPSVCLVPKIGSITDIYQSSTFTRRQVNTSKARECGMCRRSDQLQTNIGVIRISTRTCKAREGDLCQRFDQLQTYTSHSHFSTLTNKHK